MNLAAQTPVQIHRHSSTVFIAMMIAGAVTACGRGEHAQAPASVASDQVLRRGLGAEPGTLDPRLAEDNAAITVVTDLEEGLTTEEPDGSIVPGAASSWTVDEVGLRYVWVLRPNLRWSNGDPLVAEHFVAGLHKALDPQTAAPNAGLLEAIDDVRATDASTIVVHLRRPVPYLPALLALPIAAPLHPAAGADHVQVSSGAYRLVSRTPGEHIDLDANPYYRDASSVSIPHVRYVVVTDLTAELNLFRTRALDVTSEVPNTQLDRLRKDFAADLRIAPFLSVYAYAVNFARLPDVNVRRALALGTDRMRITQQVTGAGETPALGWVPDGIPRYEAARFDWQSLSYPQAAARARELWAAAPHKPRNLKLCTDASANHHRTAVALADLWHSALGIETQIEELEWNVYLDKRHHPGDCDLVRLGWSADFLDPEAFATVFETGNPQNTLGYSSTTYDELLARSRKEQSIDARMKLLAQAEARALEDVPVIPIFFRVSKRLVQPDVQGVGANPLDHIPSRALRFGPP